MEIIGLVNKRVVNGTKEAGEKLSGSGNWYPGHSVKSSFGRPTNNDSSDAGWGLRFMGCDFGVSVAILDDLETYVSIDTGNIETSMMPNGSTHYGWPKSFLAASLKDFGVCPSTSAANKFWIKCDGVQREITYQKATSFGDGDQIALGMPVNMFYTDFGIYCPLGGGKAYSWAQSNWTDSTQASAGTGGSYQFPARSSEVYKGRDFGEMTKEQVDVWMANRGYYSIGKLTQLIGDDGIVGTGVVYIAGMCLFNSDTAGSWEYTSAARIEISELVEYLDYYPWARFVDGEWRSLNRTGGSLKRYNGGWQDVKNSYGSGTSKGFRHNGSTWVKSPKTGRE